MNMSQATADHEQLAARFCVITTGDLPEAWFLVHHLRARGCAVAVLNARARPRHDQWRIVWRLARRHGLRYVAGLLAARRLRSLYQRPGPEPFPEIDAAAIAELRTAVAVHDADDLHAPAALAFVRAQAPDWILIAGAPVLRPALYGLARCGALNRHLGISPLYRGSDCPIWSLAAGDIEHFGFTIHAVVERVDGGAVLLQRRVELVPDEDFAQTMARINRAGSEGYAEVLDGLLAGRPVPTDGQAAGGRHYPPAPIGVIRRAWRRHARLRHERPRVPA